MPYERDPKSKARYWAIPGDAGMEHRVGGLEKDELTGNVSYDPINHEHMVKVREEKVNLVANYIPELEVDGSQSGDLLIVGWGGTYGSLFSAIKQLNIIGIEIGLAHFNFINPLPKNTAKVFKRFKNILVCELNDGQFLKHLRGLLPEFKYEAYNKVQGLPFTVAELTQLFTKKLGEIKK